MTVVGITVDPNEKAPHPTYIAALEQAGAVILPISIRPDIDIMRSRYELIDALLLPGGDDVDPGRYGVARREDCHVTVIPELDETELTLAEWAIADGMPVLGICRGIQVLNVACGGTLWQDLLVEGVVHESHDQEQRDLLAHGLDIEAGSVLERTTGKTHLEVNSMHHQAIRDVGPPLRAVAKSTDGLIEGVELPGTPFVVGIQCHPEELVATQEWARSLFGELVEAGERYRSVRGQGPTRSAR
ncbi:MAG TPA: gamma-glutamyl-gamma-aminobutyrate hydrolase family protein [Candidatus Dormibacteraeota bacterium]|nr:gamma-glutamyl-gamma-aminobutyrate hydrolase family protein [Candidatus Dormibacteraeota bacterium]